MATGKVLFALLLAIFGLVALVRAVPPFATSANSERYEATHIVLLEAGADAASVASTHDIAVTVPFRHIFNGFAGAVPEDKLKGLKHDPRVTLVEPNMAFHLQGETVPTGVRRIGANRNLGNNPPEKGGRVPVVVGVLDTGVQGDHPDLNVNIGSSVDCASPGPICTKGQARDTNGHGTHVAGTIAALNNGVGVVGVAPGAEIWSIRVCSSACFLDHILKGHEYVSANADTIAVINVSLGGLGWSVALRAAINDNVEQGVIVVVAAGNDSTDIYGGDGTIGNGNEMTPAAYPEALAVSALADTDGKAGGVGPDTIYGPDDSLASFSNFSIAVAPDNPVRSPGAAIDWAAPGVKILSTYKGSSYATLSGTSMAAPHGAGAAALYIAANGRAFDAAGVAAVRQALIDSCQVMAAWRPDSLDVDSDPDANHEGIVNVQTPQIAHDISINATNSPAAVAQGDTVEVLVDVGNKGVNEETFTVSLKDLTDDTTIGSQLVTLTAGDATTVGFTWNTAGSTLGPHLLLAGHDLADDDGTNNSLSSEVTIQEPAPALDVAIITDEDVYEDRDTVRVTVKVTSGPDFVEGASVHVDVTASKGTHLVNDGTTDDEGVFEFKLRINAEREGCGPYTVDATASKNRYKQGKRSSTFGVAC